MQRQKAQLKEQMKLEDLKVLEYIKEKTVNTETVQWDICRNVLHCDYIMYTHACAHTASGGGIPG